MEISFLLSSRKYKLKEGAVKSTREKEADL